MHEGNRNNVTALFFFNQARIHQTNLAKPNPTILTLSYPNTNLPRPDLALATLIWKRKIRNNGPTLFRNLPIWVIRHWKFETTTWLRQYSITSIEPKTEREQLFSLKYLFPITQITPTYYFFIELFVDTKYGITKKNVLLTNV